VRVPDAYEPAPSGYEYAPSSYEHAPYAVPQPPYEYAGPAWWPPAALAGWGERLVARLIDVFLVLLVTLVPALSVVIPVAASTGGEDGSSPPGWATAVILLAILYGVLGQIVGYLWYLGWRQGATGTTIGKRAMGIALVDLDTGEPVGTMRGLGREALRLLLGSASISILSYLWPLWDARRQTWEDMVFKSVVVRHRQDA
jgi:uncharacterized RDD family membrane protein YckC